MDNLSELEEKYLDEKRNIFSFASFDKESGKFPTTFLHHIKKEEDELFEMGAILHVATELQLAYSTIRFKNYYRCKKNFHSANIIMLDMDNPGKKYTIEKTINKLNKLKIFASIITSKSHNVQKGNSPACDRFHILIPVASIITNPDSYIKTAKVLSQLIFNGKDDNACHDAARFFFPSPIDAKTYNVIGEDFKYFTPIEIQKEFIEKKNRVLIPSQKTSYIDVPLLNDYCDKYIKTTNPQLRISHFNGSNGTINLHRNLCDKNPGLFMFIDDNRIFDDVGNRVHVVEYSFDQIVKAEESKRIGIDVLRTTIKNTSLNTTSPEVEYNVLLTSEGLGKSTLIPDLKQKFNAKRIIIACKSYEQLNGKIQLLQKNNPELSIEVIPSTEKLLQKWDVKARRYSVDEETGHRYLSFKLSVDADTSLMSHKKYEAIKDKQYFDSVLMEEIHKDLVFMTEDKLKTEVLVKRHLLHEPLIIFDEFNSDLWFSVREPKDYEKSCLKLHEKIFSIETWPGAVVDLIKEDISWYSLTRGNKIILSTEDKVVLFFKKKIKPEKLNIIDERTTFYTEKTLFRSIKAKILNSQNKNILSHGLNVNDYLTVGNGINSRLNNVSVLGQNYHEEFEGQKISVLVTQPCPQELAVLMSNLEITSEEATLLKMIDTTNQIIGRCQGFRSEVNIKSMEVLFPDNLINEILPRLRYIAPVVRTHDNQNNIVDRIIHTLYHKICNFQADNSLLLTSLLSRISQLRSDIIEQGSSLIEKVKALKYFNFKNKLIESLQSDLFDFLSKSSNEKDLLDLYSDFYQSIWTEKKFEDIRRILHPLS